MINYHNYEVYTSFFLHDSKANYDYAYANERLITSLFMFLAIFINNHFISFLDSTMEITAILLMMSKVLSVFVQKLMLAE